MKAAIKLAYNLWLKTNDKNFPNSSYSFQKCRGRRYYLMSAGCVWKHTSHSASRLFNADGRNQLQQVILYYQHELLNKKTSKQSIFSCCARADIRLALLNKNIIHRQTTGDSRYYKPAWRVLPVIQSLPGSFPTM